jgi:hypothetical protein
MLFKILKLFGLDVPAKVAAAKSMIEQRVEEVTDYAKQVTQTTAVIAALSAVAGFWWPWPWVSACSPCIGPWQKATGSTPDWASSQGF